MSAQWMLRSACASLLSDQSLGCSHEASKDRRHSIEEVLMATIILKHNQADPYIHWWENHIDSSFHGAAQVNFAYVSQQVFYWVSKKWA